MSPGRTRPEARVAQQVVHVGEAGHEPQAAVGMAEHRRLGPQGGEHRVGIGDEGRIADVEAGPRCRSR